MIQALINGQGIDKLKAHKKEEIDMAELKVEVQECILKEYFKGTMQGLLEKGAAHPTEVSMSDWYYMQDHAQKCNFCLERFEQLAKEARKGCYIDGPTTLRR